MKPKPKERAFFALSDEQRLRAFQEVIERSPVGVAILDTHLRFVYINPALAAINGVLADGHISRHERDVITDVYAKCGERLRQIVGSRATFPDEEFEAETPALPGQKRIWLESWYPIDSDTDLPLVAVAVRDITDERRMAAALLDSDRRKDALLSTLAHELRSPLSAISNISALLMQMATGAASNLGAMLQRQVTQLSRLVSDLGDAGAIREGRLNFTNTTFKARDWILGALETCTYEFQQKDIHLDAELPRDGIVVSGDRVRLTQVLCNVLGNAVKYTQPGGRVTIGSEEVHNRLVVRVRDNGIGLQPGDEHRIFERFGRTEEGQRVATGLGIGLWLSRQIIEAHGGTLTAKSEGPFLGTSFNLSIPLQAR